MAVILPGDVLVGDTSAYKTHFFSLNGANQQEHVIGAAETILQGNPNGVVLDSSRSAAYYALSSSPYVAKVTVSTGARAANPGVLPAGAGNAIAISADDSEVVLAHATNPYITRYATSTMTKQSDPANPPAGTANGAAYSGNGTWLAVAHATTPFVTIYERATMTKLANPGTLPPTTGNNCAFSADSSRLCVVTANTTPRMRVYNTSDWSAVTLSSTVGSVSLTHCAFSSAGTYLAVGSSSAAAATAIYIYNTSTWAHVSLPSLTSYRIGAVRALQWLSDKIVCVVMDASFVISVLIINVATSTVLRSVQMPHVGAYSAAVAPGGGYYEMSGTVTSAASPGVALARAVRAYDRGTGKFMGQTTSTVSGSPPGTWAINTLHNRSCTVIAIGEPPEESQIFDQIIPAEV